jgi:hypothetical protein
MSESPSKKAVVNCAKAMARRASKISGVKIHYSECLDLATTFLISEVDENFSFEWYVNFIAERQ